MAARQIEAVSRQRRRFATRPQKMTLTPQLYADGEKIATEYGQKYGYKEFQRLAKYLEILAQTAIAKDRVVPAFQHWLDVYCAYKINKYGVDVAKFLIRMLFSQLSFLRKWRNSCWNF